MHPRWDLTTQAISQDSLKKQEEFPQAHLKKYQPIFDPICVFYHILVLQTIIKISKYSTNLSFFCAQLKNSNNGTVAVINGNYALSSGISLSTALATEDKNSEAALTYANILAVKAGNEERQAIKDLVKLLTSEKVKNYISSSYQGAVLPL